MRNSITENYKRRKNADFEKLYNEPSVKIMVYAKSLNGSATCGELM